MPVDEGASPVRPGVIGELFHVTRDAALVVRAGRVAHANAAARRRFDGLDGLDGLDLAPLLAAPADGTVHRSPFPPHGVFDVVRRVVGGHDVLLLRDVTAEVRRVQGLQRLARIGRELLGEPPAVATVLQSMVTEAKVLTDAAYSALLLLRPGSDTETSHFVYDAPRHLFPDRMPRVVGLLAVPVSARSTVRVDDIRGHPAGVGLPGVHPPIGPLVAVPIMAGDVVLGELAVANPPDGRPFDEVDQELLLDLAAHVAVAVRWSQQAERARQQDLQRQEVVDTARHDVRTPLGAGKGYVLLLSRKMARMSPEQVVTALEGIVQSFDRIEAFTDRLLADSRDELVGVTPELETVELAPLLDAVRRDAAATTGRDVVRVEQGPTAPSSVRADPAMLREVIDNLVGNALKHSPADRPVVLSVRTEGRHVRLDVRDEGPGIDEAEQGALFERWTRTDSSRARQLPGFGLGLSIVKRLVTAHDGLLGVSSRAGEGATFWVTFPPAGT